MHELEQVKKINVQKEVLEQIKKHIVNGYWSPGTKIPSENQLSKKLGVSRISVRAAVQCLIALDILESKQGEGTYVKELNTTVYLNSLIPLFVLSKKDIIAMLDYREIMEVGIIELVSQNATREDIQELERILEKMILEKSNYELFAEYDANFHLYLAKMSKNSVIIKINQVISAIFSLSMKNIVQVLGTSDGIYYHRKIIEALKERDQKLCKKIMSEHIKKTKKRIQSEMLNNEKCSYSIDTFPRDNYQTDGKQIY
jgi:GntR family transcriptional repressor for pyruvate dehydrogenase complex